MRAGGADPAALEEVPIAVVLQAPLDEVPVLRDLLRVAQIERRAIRAQDERRISSALVRGIRPTLRRTNACTGS